MEATTDTSGGRREGGRYEYDTAHQLIQSRRGAQTTDYSYDAAGRLVRESGPQGTSTIGYDPLGRIAVRTAPDGERRFVHTGDDLLAELTTVPVKQGKGRKAVVQRFRWSNNSDVPRS